MCGVGYTKLIIDIVGNTGLNTDSSGKYLATPNSDVATTISTDDLIQGVPKTYVVFAIQKPYYVLTALLTSSSMLVTATIYQNSDPFSPYALGAVYNKTSASFTPGAVFMLKNMNLNTGGVFSAFGDTTRFTSDLNMYSTPCSPSATVTCPTGTEILSNPDLSEMFTLEVISPSTGLPFLMLRNLKYGYVYGKHNDSGIYVTTDAVNVTNGTYGKWYVISALDSTIPSTPFWWDTDAGKSCLTEDDWDGYPHSWTKQLNPSGAAVGVNAQYLFYTDNMGTNYTLQTGCVQLCQDVLSCRPQEGWHYLFNTQTVGPDNLDCQTVLIQNFQYVLVPYTSTNNKIPAKQLWLPNGPLILDEPPTTAKVKYVINFLQGNEAGECDDYHYESQAVNSNFYFELLDNVGVMVLSSEPSFDYSALCYQVVNSSYPYAVLESSAGQTTCPTWAMVGYPKLPSASPAVCAPGKATKSTGHTSTASTCTKWTPDISSELAANRKQAAATFITEVCGKSYNNGVNGYICLDLLDQTSSRCSGFRTQNFAKACAFACSENPDACDKAKQNYCLQGAGQTGTDSCGYACDNDCACQVATSPFRNTMTEIPSTNGLTLAEYKKAENLAVDQAADVQCWWHPCVVDTYPALQTTTGECQISTYLSCIAEAQGGTITAGSTVDIDLYNACYLSQLTGSSKGNSSASNAQNNVKPADDGSTGADGSTGGPAAAPPPVVKKKKGLSLAAILGIVGGVVVFVAVALFVGYAVAKKNKKA